MITTYLNNQIHLRPKKIHQIEHEEIVLIRGGKFLTQYHFLSRPELLYIHFYLHITMQNNTVYIQLM